MNIMICQLEILCEGQERRLIFAPLLPIQNYAAVERDLNLPLRRNSLLG